MTEFEVARRFGQRAGDAARNGDVRFANSERDAFREWCYLVAAGPRGHDLRVTLQREFESAYWKAKLG